MMDVCDKEDEPSGLLLGRGHLEQELPFAPPRALHDLSGPHLDSPELSGSLFQVPAEEIVVRVMLPLAVHVVESPVKTHGSGEFVKLLGAFRGDHVAPMIVDDHLFPYSVAPSPCRHLHGFFGLRNPILIRFGFHYRGKRVRL